MNILFGILLIVLAILSKKRELWWQKQLYLAKQEARINAYKEIEKTKEWKDSEDWLERNVHNEIYWNLRCMLKRKIVSGL